MIQFSLAVGVVFELVSNAIRPGSRHIGLLGGKMLGSNGSYVDSLTGRLTNAFGGKKLFQHRELFVFGQGCGLKFLDLT